VRCIPCEVAFQTRCYLNTFTFEKKLGVVVHFQDQICKNHMRQNVGNENEKQFFRKMSKLGIFFHLKFPHCIELMVIITGVFF
jgi:hypothetical protein